MYRDLYLKFESKEQADELLFDKIEAVLDAEGNEVQPEFNKPKFMNTDVIGDIYRPTGKKITVDDIEVPEMKKLDGYHVNLRVAAEDTSAIDQYKVEPANPARVWG